MQFNISFCKDCEFQIDSELRFKFKIYEYNSKKCCHEEFIYLIDDNVYDENYYKDRCPLKDRR